MPAFIDLSPGDVVIVGDAEIALEYKTGPRARLAVNAPDSVKITIKKTGRMSATTVENTHGKHPLRQRPAALS